MSKKITKQQFNELKKRMEKDYAEVVANEMDISYMTLTKIRRFKTYEDMQRYNKELATKRRTTNHFYGNRGVM